MEYRIYILFQPKNIQDISTKIYHMETTERMVLELPKYSTGLSGVYSSEEDAVKAIIDNKEKIKGNDLCILPVISLNWNGDIVPHKGFSK